MGAPQPYYPYAINPEEYERKHQLSQDKDNLLYHTSGSPPGDPDRRSTSSGNPDSSDPRRKAASEFPDNWPEDRDFLNIYFIAGVDDAAWITREIYKEIDRGTISASLYIERSENSIQIGGPIVKRRKGNDAEGSRDSLVRRIKDKLKGIFGL
jgi:hypothetical protein